MISLYSLLLNISFFTIKFFTYFWNLFQCKDPRRKSRAQICLQDEVAKESKVWNQNEFDFGKKSGWTSQKYDFNRSNIEPLYIIEARDTWNFSSCRTIRQSFTIMSIKISYLLDNKKIDFWSLDKNLDCIIVILHIKSHQIMKP